MRLDKNSPPERVVFNGIQFNRMGGSRKYYLSTSTTNAGRKNPKGLHVYIWEFSSGEKCPKGYEIHHRDGDTFNFEFDNLECLPRDVHKALPRKLDMEKIRKNLDLQRPKASAWHKSPEGRAWHRENSKRIVKKVFIPRNHVCIHCGISFVSRKPGAGTVKFCSNLCGERHRDSFRPREKKHKIKCIVCGAEKLAQRKDGKFCSRACSNGRNRL